MDKFLYNGQIKSGKIEIAVSSKALNFGEGLFETVLYQNGRLFFLGEHLLRLSDSVSFFGYDVDLRNLTEDKILNFIDFCGLKNHTLRVKILCFPEGSGKICQTLVYAAIYNRPEEAFVAAIHNEPVVSSLRKHKILSYHENLYWKNFYENKFSTDEVLFVNRKGRVEEGSFTNILAVWNKNLYYVDEREPYLQGIMQQQIIKHAGELGIKKVLPKAKGFPLQFLERVDEVILTNSLLIAAAVDKIIYSPKYVIEKNSNQWSQKLRKLFLQQV